MTEFEGQAARLHRLIETNKTNPKRFAEAVGVSPSFIYQILSATKGISAKVIFGISRAYPKTNLTWLLEGTGEENPTDSADVSAESNYKYDGPLQGLIDLLEKHERRLDEQDARIKYVESLLKEGRGYESKG